MNQQQDPRQRFGDRVDNYVAARPRYPAGVIDVLTQKIGFSSSWVVADIGSGTGISAELFLRNANTVYAVEPNDAMRQAAERLLRGQSGFHSLAAAAEATGLPAGSVDLVVAAQAFHWFDIGAFRAECARILRPGGAALLMWNDRDDSADGFAIDYERLLMRFGTDYCAVRHRNVSPTAIAAFFGGEPMFVELPNQQTLDWDGLKARLLSSSYVPPAGDSRSQAMLTALRELFDRHEKSGHVTIYYRTQMYFGAIRPLPVSRDRGG